MKAILLAFFLFVALSNAFKVGDRACISTGLNLRSSPCGNVVKTSHGGETGVVRAIQRQQCSFGTYTWISVEVNGLGKVWAAQETKLVHVCNPGGGKTLNIPMVHQVWDTPNEFAGHWACGPTSAVMIAAYYKRLTPKPITINTPTRHTNDFGWYVSNVYTTPTGNVLNRGQKDSSGRIAYGAYGTCTEGGAAWAWRIQDFLKFHKLGSKFYDTATPQIVVNAINAGHPVILSNQLTRAGHLIVVKGYENNGQILITNDPYGNAAGSGYGRHMDGFNVRYSWSYVKAKWMVEVWG